MHSEVPKVLHPVAGHPLLEWVLRAAKAAGCDETLVVVGHGADQVRESISHQGVTWIMQEEQLGTGHALAQTASYIKTAATVLVLSGDAPLVSTETLAGLAETAESGWGAVAAAEVDEPGSLGRVLADANGSLKRIVEAADADDETLRVKLVNAGMYAFTAPDIFDYLSQLKADNAKSELYLTDALGDAVADGRVVSILNLSDPAESLGVNTRVDLARVNRELRRRKNNQLMTAGVTILDPEATYIL